MAVQESKNSFNGVENATEEVSTAGFFYSAEISFIGHLKSSNTLLVPPGGGVGAIPFSFKG
jgi:hypothetical protein